MKRLLLSLLLLGLVGCEDSSEYARGTVSCEQCGRSYGTDVLLNGGTLQCPNCSSSQRAPTEGVYPRPVDQGSNWTIVFGVIVLAIIFFFSKGSAPQQGQSAADQKKRNRRPATIIVISTLVMLGLGYLGLLFLDYLQMR